MADQPTATEQTASASYDKLVDVTMRLDESNKLAAEAIISSKETSAEAKETAQKTIDAIKTGHSDGSEKPHGDTTKHHSFLEGHFGWMKKEAERASKLAKLGLGKVSDFGKAAASKVEHFAKNILDLLLKGLGLAALWALFKWASEADWEGILTEAMKWWEKIKAAWKTFEESLGITNGWIRAIDGAIKKWNEEWEIMDGYLHQMWTVMKAVSGWFLAKKVFDYGRLLFGEKSFIRLIFKDIWRVFGPKSTLGIAVGRLLKVSFFKMFGWAISPLGRLVTHLRTVFGAGSEIADTAKDAKRLRDAKMFGPNSAIGRLIAFFRGTRQELKMIPGLSTGKAVTVTESPIVRIYKAIRGYFAHSPFLAGILKDIKGTTTFTVLFGEGSAIRGMITWIGGLFGTGGGFGKALIAIKESKVLGGALKFLGVIGTKFLGIMNPIIWLIAAYDAIAGEGGFMDAFKSEEGSLWDKTMAGLSAAVTKLLDFFLWDLGKLIGDAMEWIIKKFAGLFGIEEKDYKDKAWFKFDVVGTIKDFFDGAIKLIEGFLTMNPEKMKEGLAKMWGAFTGAVDWLWQLILRPALDFIAKNVFGMKEEDLMGDQFSLTKWITEKIIDPIWNVLKKIFEFDYLAFIKNNKVLYWLAREAGILPESKEDLTEDLESNKKEIASLEKAKKTMTGATGKRRLEAAEKRLAFLNKQNLELEKQIELAPKQFVPEKTEEQIALQEKAEGKGYKSPFAKRTLVKPALEVEGEGYSAGGSFNGMTLAPAVVSNKTSNPTTMVQEASRKDNASQKYMMVGRKRVKVG